MPHPGGCPNVRFGPLFPVLRSFLPTSTGFRPRLAPMSVFHQEAKPMGQRGPAGKDPAQRQRRNDRNVVELVPATPEASPEIVPEPRKSWLKPTKEEFSSYLSSTVAQAVDAASDLSTLERLFDLKDKHRRWEKAAKGKEIVPGSQGQPILNPLLKEAHSLLGEIRQLEDRFGMTPQSRARLGVAIGTLKSQAEEMNRRLATDDDSADPRRL